MSLCLFASDLHGSTERYRKLFSAVRRQRPAVLLLGGDLLPPGGVLLGHAAGASFLEDVVASGLALLKAALRERYPLVLLILGNDDPRREEGALAGGERRGLWHYLHNRRLLQLGHRFYGYACIPPSPFLLKDWERYDVSRHLDVGAVSPLEGWHTVASERSLEHITMRSELEALCRGQPMERAVFLFHAPPYGTALDQAALEGRMVDHAPLDVHIGSVALRRLIQERQPHITLHGHAHESARLSGRWAERLGRTFCLSAAHDGPELALVRFHLEQPGAAQRLLL